MTNRKLTNGHGPQIGDKCSRPLCTGVLGPVAKTRVEYPEQNVAVEELACNRCNTRPVPGFRVIPLKYADRASELNRVFRRDVPICPVHNEKMISYGTKGRTTYYKCKCEECEHRGQSLARVI